MDATPDAALPAPPEERRAGGDIRGRVLRGADGGAAFGRFLAEDRGALAAWFGAAGVDSRTARGRIDAELVRIDRLLSRQLDAVLHHPRFARLEGSWRGLRWLLDASGPMAGPGTGVRVKVMAASWRELARDLGRSLEVEQSGCFRLVYENEFGRPGGEPFGLLVVDHEMRHRRPPREATATEAPVDDLSTLAALAAVANAAFVPTVAGASPALLGADRFGDLAAAADPAAVMRGPDYARWRATVARPEFRFVGLTAPRVLARAPWRPDPHRPDGFDYAEHAPRVADRCWCVGAYAFAAVAIRAHAGAGWAADIRGVMPDVERGALVPELPGEAMDEDGTRHGMLPSLDVLLTDEQERSLARAGVMALNRLPFGERVAFASVNSLQGAAAEIPGRAPGPAQVNATLSAQLGNMLGVSRFAHCIKIMGREFIGSQLGANQIERRLQDWLGGYTNSNSEAGPEMRARFPLFLSRVAVHELEGRPGMLGCVIHLQPHHQLDEVATTFQLTTTLSGSGAAGGTGNGAGAAAGRAEVA